MRDIASILRREDVKEKIKASPYIDTLIEYLEQAGDISSISDITKFVDYIYSTFNLTTLEGYFNTLIPEGAFKSLVTDHLELPEGIRCIEAVAFSGAIIGSITFPESLNEICAEAFRGVKLLSDVYLPDSLTFLSSSSFQNCFQLSSVSISCNVVYGGKSVFNGCKKLTEITYRGTVDQWNVFIKYNHDFLTDSYIKTVKCVDGEIAVN